MTNSASVTQLLHEYREGDAGVLPDLFSQVYDELKRIAAREKRRVINADTINTSALVNEAYLKLVCQQKLEVDNRAHFLAVSAMAMRQILINYIEQKHARKRGGDLFRVSLVTMANTREMDMENLLSINRALEQLQQLDDKLASLVEMRFFAGMTESEIAQAMNTTERTVRRNWSKARALLQHILESNTGV